MAMLLGYITLFSLLLMLGKYPARMSKNKELNQLFWRLHKPASGLFFIGGIVHLVLVIWMCKARCMMLVGSGIVSFGIAILLIALCHMMKDEKEKMLWHRILSGFLGISVIVHIISYFI